MTEEDLVDLMNDESLETGDFDDIPVRDRLNPDKKVCGILKVQSLLKEPEEMWLSMWASHDEFGLCGADDICERATKDDVIYLHRCGIYCDSDGGIYMFT